MTTLLTKTVLGSVLAATALTAAAPAEAQYRGYRGGRHHDGIGSGGAAVLGGLVGLGLGAAIASSNNRDRYYDRGGYDRGYYDGPGPRGGYYYDNYPRGGYYQDYRRNYRPSCYVERRYDPYWGRRVDVRVCR